MGAKHSSWRTARWLFVVALCVYVATAAGRPRVIDENMVLCQTESLIARGQLAVPQAVERGMWYGLRGQDGKEYTPYGPAQAVFTVPFLWVGQQVVSLAGVGGELAFQVANVGAAMATCLWAAAALSLFYVVLIRLGCTHWPALVLAIGLGFSTSLWPYAGTLFSEPLVVLLVVGALLMGFGRQGGAEVVSGRARGLAKEAASGGELGVAQDCAPSAASAAQPDPPDRAEAEPKTPSWSDELSLEDILARSRRGEEPKERVHVGGKATDPAPTALSGVTDPVPGGAASLFLDGLRALAVGLLLGLCVLVRPAHVFLVFAFGCGYLAQRSGWLKRLSTAVCFGVGGGVGVATLLYLNAVTYGSVWEFGYPKTAELGRALNAFSTPLLTGLYGLLLSPGKALFLFCPLALLGLLGLRRLWQEHRPLAVTTMVGLVCYLLFYAGFAQWEGGWCVGPRYLMVLFPLLILPVVSLLRSGRLWARLCVFVLVAVGVCVQVPFVATSFVQAQVGSQSYYDGELRYRMDHKALAEQWQLVERYGAEALAGRPMAGELGLGWDTWWVFLYKVAREQPAPANKTQPSD